MDIKLVILLAVAIAIIFLLMNEMSTLRDEMDKKMSELNNRITKYNEDTKTSFKRETKEMSAKYKAYTSDMVKEIRMMNNIENQAITHMSDQFAEGDSVDRVGGIPHLSDIHPRHRYQPDIIYPRMNPQEKTNSKSTSKTGEDGDAYYMSPVSDEFRIKDNGELLPSAKMQTETEEEESENYEEDSDAEDEIDDGDEFDDGEVEEEDSEVEEEDDEESEAEYEVDEGVEEDEGEEDDEDEDEDGGEEDEDDEDEDDEDEDEDVEDDESEVDDIVDDEEVNETLRAKQKLESYHKIRASMEEDVDDLSSENITFGSTNKGSLITVKGISRKKKDDLSIATDDDDFRLKSISRYTKQDLVDIASQRGLNVSERSNKTTIYNFIKQNL